MFCFGVGILVYFAVMLTFLQDSPYLVAFCVLSLILNFYFFLRTMFGEQGVPQNVYERYFKIFYVEKNKNKDDEESLTGDGLNKTNTEGETTDLESVVQK